MLRTLTSRTAKRGMKRKGRRRSSKTHEESLCSARSKHRKLREVKRCLYCLSRPLLPFVLKTVSSSTATKVSLTGSRYCVRITPQETSSAIPFSFRILIKMFVYSGMLNRRDKTIKCHRVCVFFFWLSFTQSMTMRTVSNFNN